MKPLTRLDLMNYYEQIINEQEPPVELLDFQYEAGTTLRLLDPVAFNESFNQFLDEAMAAEEIAEDENGYYWHLMMEGED